MASLATEPSRDPVVLAALWEMVPFGIALLDEQLRFLRVNGRLADMDGVPAQDHAGRSLSEVAPVLGPLFGVVLRRVLETGVPVSSCRIHADPRAGAGMPAGLELACTLVAPPSGGPPALLLIVTRGREESQAEEQLRQTRTLLNESEAIAGLGSWAWDLATNTITWSDEVYRQFGVTPDTFGGQFEDYLALLPAEDRERVASIISGSLESGVAFHMDHGLVRPDGGRRVLECRGRVERDQSGRTVRMAGTVLDITERKRTEQQLREQERFVDAIVENLPNMIFVKEAQDLRFVRFNRAGEELLGYTRDQLLGRNDFDFFPASEAAHFVAQDRTVLASGQVLDCPEDEIHTRGKGVRILRSKKVPILDGQGKPAFLLGISEDVTEQKRAEAFRLSDLLVRSMEDYAIFLLDAAGRVKTWNAGAERVTGYAEAEIVGRPVAILRSPGAQLEEDTLLVRAAAEGHVVEEGAWCRKDGGIIWRTTAVTAIRDDNGALILFGVVTRDLTARKRAEDERELLLARLQEAVRHRDEFLSVASHELRTPVATLKLQAELLDRMRHRAPEEVTALLPPMLDRIRRQADRLDKLVSQLLDVTRLATGKTHIELVEGELGAIVEAVVLRVQEETRGRPPIRLRVLPGLAGRWDVLRLDQVITNLLSNAIKYGLDRPIDVVVERDDGGARITVRDQGIGIAPGDQARIFGQFERAVSERNYGGLGLGLFIVRQIIEAMSGTVSVESCVGEGAAFVVRLPLEK